MSREIIGVGLIGLGLISRAHIEGYKQARQDAKIVAVCDSDESVVNAVAARLDARAYTGHKELLRDLDVRAVDIMLPHNLHYQVAKDAISSGRHVIVEKPMTVKAAESLELIHLARANGVTLTAAENTPFVTAYREVEQFLEQEALGQVRLIRTFIYGSEVERLRNTANWKGRRAGSCGGVIIDAGVHSFFLLKWLFGNIETVQANSARLVRESEVEDYAAITGRMSNGAVFSTEYTFTAEIPWGERLEVYGSSGSLIIDQIASPPALFFRNKTDITGLSLDVPYDPLAWKTKSIANGIQDFIEALRDSRSPRVDPQDCYYVSVVVEKAYESIAKLGQSVQV